MLNKKTKRIAIIVVVSSALTQLIAAIIYGMGRQWLHFGILLTGCIIMMIFYTGILIAFKIDSCFDELKELIEDKNKNEEEKV